MQVQDRARDRSPRRELNGIDILSRRSVAHTQNLFGSGRIGGVNAPMFLQKIQEQSLLRARS